MSQFFEDEACFYFMPPWLVWWVKRKSSLSFKVAKFWLGKILRLEVATYPDHTDILIKGKKVDTVYRRHSPLN